MLFRKYVQLNILVDCPDHLILETSYPLSSTCEILMVLCFPIWRVKIKTTIEP